MTETFFDEAALAAMADELAARCKVMAAAREAPLRPWRRREASFAGLARVIAFQQLAGAAATAIWGRVEARLPEMTPQAFLAVSEEELRALGLSRPKIGHIRAIAEAVRDGALDFAVLAEAPEEEARAMMTAVRGIGPWTADLFLMGAYGRLDVFPVGDLGLQNGYMLAARKRKRPTPKSLGTFAKRWSPTRSVAALMLWAYVDEVRERQKRETKAEAK